MEAGKPEIREHLRGVNRQKPLDGLEFHKNRIFDDEISSKANLDDVSTVLERYRALPIEGE